MRALTPEDFAKAFAKALLGKLGLPAALVEQGVKHAPGILKKLYAKAPEAQLGNALGGRFGFPLKAKKR